MNVIEVKDLRKEYGNVIAVDGISFEVRSKEIFSLLGPNGAGKTTTVEIIEGIRNATEGTVKIFGKSMDAHIKEKIGVLPQEFQSFERLTVRETLIYFSRLYKKCGNIDEIISIVGLKEKENELYKNLSGGQRQRVGVAVSLVGNPELVFLDEPTTGLDPAARRGLWNVIKKLKEDGKTVFLTTHYMEEAEYLSDRVAIMHNGKIISIGSPKELIEKYGEKTRIIISIKDKLIEIETEEDEIPELIEKIRRDGTKYDRIEIKRANLEDVFLKLTGARLK
ncbi:MAG: ABC transporter ATP-binding protein [Thermoplasmata archaeon]|nr:MAG: ABC transporter ATP-binding protein [Thermoplasmata archaeon]MCD6170798.1 ABC transporter ATP-binding protein [Thermoplasmata archaeon]